MFFLVLQKNQINIINYLVLNILNVIYPKKKQIENKLNRNFDYIVNLSGYINHSNAKKVKLTHYEACKNLANFFKKKKN